MTVQCKKCQKLHVDGKWTESQAQQVSNVYTFCPSCQDSILKIPLEHRQYLGNAVVLR